MSAMMDIDTTKPVKAYRLNCACDAPFVLRNNGERVTCEACGRHHQLPVGAQIMGCPWEYDKGTQ